MACNWMQASRNGLKSLLWLKCSAESLEEEEAYLPLRENFAETAFFYPDLRTDSAGNVRIVFTMPDALTEWKLMGLAHTRELDYGLITAKAKTNKPFMIQPNMPRFIRVGDRTTLMASLNNLSAETVSGVARMQLAHPITGKVVYSGQQPFRVEAGENGSGIYVRCGRGTGNARWQADCRCG